MKRIPFFVVGTLLLSLAITFIRCGEKQKSTSSSSNLSIAVDPLPSWNEGDVKRSIIDFVSTVTTDGSAEFIPVSDRIAVFDNDGTLWPEQPVPNQIIFAIDNLKALAPSNPDFQNDVMLKGVLNGDLAPLRKEGKPGLLKLLNASHNNQTETDFANAVRTWADTAKDEKFSKLYKDLVYQPMLELLDYLRANNFKTFIVSGGGADFMRPWCEEVYGIPPYQVIGSYGEVKYEVVDGKPVITKISGTPYIDDKAGKPIAIHRFIGKIPVFCVGNSDGDQEMLQYTSSNSYKNLNLILHHTDSIREYKYDLHTLSGHLENALVEAKEKNWLVANMKKDFRKIFYFE